MLKSLVLVCGVSRLSGKQSLHQPPVFYELGPSEHALGASTLVAPACGLTVSYTKVQELFLKSESCTSLAGQSTPP